MNYTVRKRLICDWTNDYVYDIMDGEKLIRSCIGTLKMTIAIAKEKGWELDIDFYHKQELERVMPSEEELICGFIVWMNKIERAHFDFTKEKLKGYVNEYLISVKLDISLKPK